MTDDNGTPRQVEALLATEDLAGALDNDQFRRFLDQVPIAIILSEIRGAAAGESIAYANPEFEQLAGVGMDDLRGKPWDIVAGVAAEAGAEAGASPLSLGQAIAAGTDRIGTFRIDKDGAPPALVDVYSNLIQNDAGASAYRLAMLVDVGAHGPDKRQEIAEQLRERDIRLLEIQHRVKNNLQMIAALIRIEARNTDGGLDSAPFHRLAGRIEAIQILYGLLSDGGKSDQDSTIDLGIYLSDIASSVLRSHAVEGIRLDLKVDSYPVSVNVAMPTGLVVNELLTNALKHAFPGLGNERKGGTITLHSLSDGEGCHIVIADDGIGLPEGSDWPRPGKMSAMIVRSLRQNAGASVAIESRPGQGLRVTIAFRRVAAAPAPAAPTQAD